MPPTRDRATQKVIWSVVGATVAANLFRRTPSLRVLVGALQPAADQVGGEVEPQLEIPPGSLFDVYVEVNLPTKRVAPAVEALRSIDLAWRLALLVADERRVAAAPRRSSLDDIMPATQFGLDFERVDVDSVRSVVKRAGESARDVAVYAQVITALWGAGTVIGKTEKIFFPPPATITATHPGGKTCTMHIGGRLPVPLVALDKEIGKLPKECEITIHAETSDGIRIDVSIPVRSDIQDKGDSPSGSD